MPAIVESPQVVRESPDYFADLCSNEPQRRHWAEYVTGLIVADSPWPTRQANTRQTASRHDPSAESTRES